MDALNLTYEEQEKRGSLHDQAVAIGMTLAAVAFAIIALLLIAAIPAAVQLLPLGHSVKILAMIIRWPVLIMLVSVSLAATYWYAPSREEAKWRWVSWGGI